MRRVGRALRSANGTLPVRTAPAAPITAAKISTALARQAREDKRYAYKRDET
jgi:hypothetical protein